MISTTAAPFIFIVIAASRPRPPAHRGTFVSTAGTPQLAAHEYLKTYGPLLGITPAQLGQLRLASEATPTDAPVELRFFDEKTQFDTAA